MIRGLHKRNALRQGKGNGHRRRKPRLQGIEELECRRLLDGHGFDASDVDGDGAVGFLDYLNIVQNFGNKVARGHGDIDGDGSVGADDFQSLAENFGRQRTEDLLPEEARELAAPRGVPQAQLEDSRFVQSSVDLIKSLGRGRQLDAPAFLEFSRNSDAVFYPVLQAGSLSASPPDTPSARIDANVAGSEFDGVGSIEIVHPLLGTFMCTGTAISFTHVLTAGHCFDVEADGVPDVGITGTFNLHVGGDFSSTHTVSQVNIHPDFGGFANGGNDDLAILELASPVPSSTNIFSVRAGEMAEGEVLQMVGYGQSGQGESGFTVTPSFSEKRIGANRADLFVVDDEGSGIDEVYFFDFDDPISLSDGFFGGPTLGNDIETTVGGGDSGGPAFVEVEGEHVIAGVSTFNWELPGTTAPVGFFGSLGGGVIIDSYVDWIVSISPDAIDSNDAPSFTPGADVVIDEDAGAASISWATDISANNVGQSVDFHIVSNSDPTLFEIEPEIDAAGTLTFAAKPNFNGTAQITIVLQDDGGTAYGGQNTSATHTFAIEVVPVNDAPSFSVGADILVRQDAGAQSIEGFAHDFDPGPLETEQTIAEYLVETDNPLLFLEVPQVGVDGQLTFTPRRDAAGVANGSIRVRDNGGTANGGVDTSNLLPFSITVQPVDPAPPPVEPPDLSFSMPNAVSVNEDTEGDINDFVSSIGDDVLNFQLSNDNESMFRVQPRINVTGDLMFVPKPDAFGIANVKVVAHGARGQSDSQELQITINPVNDAPSVSISGDVRVKQKSGAHQIADFAFEFDPGNKYETQSIEAFVLKYDNEKLFVTPPQVNVNGVLSFELADSAGVANVAVMVRDNGGTANGGENTSESYEFSINVVPELESPPTAVIRNGRIVVKGTGQQLLGLDFQSQAGLLSNDSTADPFGFFLSETPERVALGILGPENAVTLDGEIVTSVHYSGTNPDGDLTAAWGDIYGNSIDLDLTIEAPKLNGVIRNGSIVVKGSGQKLLGLDFQSQAGLLSNDSAADPFGFFLSETPEHVSLGALGLQNAVTLDGELATAVYYSGANPEDDLTAAWGDPQGNSVELDLTVEVPQLNAVIRNGRIVVEGNGQQLLGLDFQSRLGLLSSDPTADPFGFFLSETPERVSLGVLGTDNAVTLDGDLVTPIYYSGTAPAGDLTAHWGDLSGDLYEIEVGVETLSGFLDDDNFIVLEGTGQAVIGIDFESPDGLLVPLEDNEEKPFQFVLSNSTEHISLGMLGESVIVDGLLRTNIQYSGDLDDLSAHWGDTSGTSFELSLTRNGDECARPSLESLSNCADSLAERDAILARLGYLLADLDGNGAVSFADFLQLSDNFGKTGQSYIDGDLDLDDAVGFSDFLILADNYGKSV